MFPSSLPRPHFGTGLAVLILPAVSLFAGAPACGGVMAPAPVAATARLAPASHAAPSQVADEIVRRLRRLGINFNKTRISNPYDPEGEVC